MNEWRDPRACAARRGPRDDGLDDWDGFGGLDDEGGAWAGSSPKRGSPLPPFRPALLLQRTRFTISLPDASAATVDVDHLSGQASFYRNDRHVQTSDMPVRFALGSDSIEVAASRYGMRRIHLIRADGGQQRLDPAPGTPERWRSQLSRQHPVLSRGLAIGAVAVLVINLILIAPQLLELVTHVPLWADRFTPFVSPISLSAGANTALTLAAGIAGAERALTFRHNRLLDADTDGIEA